MAITKAQKVEILNWLDDTIANNETVAFVKFDGLNVLDTTSMRAGLRGNSVGYRVVKKSLLKRALEVSKVEGTIPEMEGNVAIAFGNDDVTAPAREVFNFKMDEHKENLEIIGGIFEGRYMDAVEMNEIATIPGLQTLRGMFVNVINSPIQGFAVVLNAIAEKKS